MNGIQKNLLHRYGRIAGFSLAALASCYLGLLFSRLLWEAPRLLVAALTDAEVIGFGRFGGVSLVPSLYVLQPNDASPLMFAAYAAGAVGVAAVLLAACAGLGDAFSGWCRLTAVFVAFWTALLLGSSAVGFAMRGRGPVSALAGLVEGAASVQGRRVVATLIVLLCWWCLTRLLQSLAGKAEANPAQRAYAVGVWFLLPVVALSIALSSGSFGRVQRFGDSLALFLVTALPVLATIRFPRTSRKPFRPTTRGAIVTVAVGLASVASVVAYSKAARQPEQPALETLVSGHWQFEFEKGAFSTTERKSWAAAADQRLEECSRRLGIPLGSDKLRSQVFRSTSSKRAVTRETRDDQPFTLSNEPPMVQELVTPNHTLADGRGESLLLMAQAWGPPASQSVAEAIARYAEGEFESHPLAEYARQIACEEQPYALAEVFEITPRYLSPIVRDALGGAWVESLVNAKGVEVLPKIYGAIPAEEGPKTIADVVGARWSEIESGWRTYLTPADASCDASPAGEHLARTSGGVPGFATHQGISFSHEVGGDWGYGSDSAQHELEKIREIGANSVGIMPYAFTRAPEETSIRFRTDETDARIVRVIEQARRAGLAVMLKPHLWGRGFTGDMKFTSEEDFEVWWESYRSWMLHFARIAELEGVELLALGNELGGMTTHEQAWRKLIRDVRRVYRGKLTYASHWDKEFERIPFWDALDYIGVNAYFPLAEAGETPSSDSPRIAEIRSALAAVAERFHKPLLFTEVGYSSIEGAAVEPWAEDTGALDLEIQKKCYEVIFESFTKEPWFAGAYWWKWPSHGRGGPYDLSHRPNGKPAMMVLQRWFLGEGAIGRVDNGTVGNQHQRQ